MGKYENLLKDIFSVFDANSWKTESINTYPSNFVALNAGSEFIRVSIIPTGKGLNLNSVSGVLLIDIFTAAGNGPRRSFVIADTIDKYLVGKTLKTVSNSSVQFGNSSLNASAQDKDNPSLARTIYSISFNFFGVF
jgi:hypothetical protein